MAAYYAPHYSVVLYDR